MIHWFWEELLARLGFAFSPEISHWSGDMLRVANGVAFVLGDCR